MKNKTAVEWLIEKIQLTDTIIDNGESSYVILFPNLKLKDIEQAKEMEKEQIKEAFKHGELPPLFVNFDAEQYYNKTFTEK